MKFFPHLKYGLYALLAFNIILFFRHASIHEGIDCIGWFMLLVMFEWETGGYAKKYGGKAVRWVLVWQVAAYGMILYAWGNYLRHHEWIDLVNATLWLGVVIMLAFDVYLQQHWVRRRLQMALKIGFYSALICITLLWGMRGDFLDFYDAMLWVVCFFAIEMNLLQKLVRQKQTA